MRGGSKQVVIDKGRANRWYQRFETGFWESLEKQSRKRSERIKESCKTPFSGLYGSSLVLLPVLVAMPLLWLRTGWWAWWVPFAGSLIAALNEATIARVGVSAYGYWKSVTIGLFVRLGQGLTIPLLMYFLFLLLNSFFSVWSSNAGTEGVTAATVFDQLNRSLASFGASPPSGISSYTSLVRYDINVLEAIQSGLSAGNEPWILALSAAGVLLLGTCVQSFVSWVRLFKTPRFWRELLGENSRLGEMSQRIEATPSGTVADLMLLLGAVWVITSIVATLSLILSLNLVLFLITNHGFSTALVVPFAWVHTTLILLAGDVVGWILGSIIITALVSFTLGMAIGLVVSYVGTIARRLSRFVGHRCNDRVVLDTIRQENLHRRIVAVWGKAPDAPQTYALDPVGLIFVIELPEPGFGTLPDSEKKAVVAHELHHVQHDARLVSVLSLLSKSSLLGQALLTAVVDYPRREFAADQAATKATQNPEALVSALNRLDEDSRMVQGLSRLANVSRSNAVLSRIRSCKFLSTIRETWRFVFGNFLVGYAHPSMEARTERIRHGPALMEVSYDTHR